MDTQQFVTKKEKLEFREIVLGHLKRILELSTAEFRGGYFKILYHGNYRTKEYVPDSRKCYSQAIDSLSDVLLPHFDTAMKTSYTTIQKRIDNIKPDLKEEQKLYAKKHLQLSRELFQKLNLLLKRVDYLKGVIYAEEEEAEEKEIFDVKEKK